MVGRLLHPLLQELRFRGLQEEEELLHGRQDGENKSSLKFSIFEKMLGKLQVGVEHCTGKVEMMALCNDWKCEAGCRPTA